MTSAKGIFFFFRAIAVYDSVDSYLRGCTGKPKRAARNTRDEPQFSHALGVMIFGQAIQFFESRNFLWDLAKGVCYLSE